VLDFDPAPLSSLLLGEVCPAGYYYFLPQYPLVLNDVMMSDSESLLFDMEHICGAQ
jgi:hypothetical protein